MDNELTVVEPILEVNFIENEKDIAEDLYRDIKLPEIEPKYYDDDKFLTQELIKNNSRKVYIIDIDLGINKKDLGLKIIRKIRLWDIFSLIIVYSAHEETKEECIRLGANIFYLKDTETYLLDVLGIRSLLKREMIFYSEINKGKYLNKRWENQTIIPAKVYDYDDEFVTLNCMIDTEKKLLVEKRFPRSIFKDFKDIDIDKSIMLTIKDRSKRICYCFDDKNVEEVDNIFKVRNDKPDFLNYSIFKLDDDTSEKP